MANSKQLRTFKLADERYVESILPKGVSKQAKDDAMSIINSTLQNDKSKETAELMSVLIDENYKFMDKNTDTHVTRFFTSLKFVAAKKTMPLIDAYEYVFPEKAKHLYSLVDGDKNKYKARVRRAVQLIQESNSIVQGIETRMLVPTYILYSGYRNEAIENLRGVMNGEAKPAKEFMYYRDDGTNQFELDEYGRKIPILDDNGNHVYQEFHQNVSPKVQVEAINSMLAATDLPKELSVDVTVKGSISTEDASASREAVNLLQSIAKQMRDEVKETDTFNIDKVQTIGNFINSKDDDEIIDVVTNEDGEEL